MLEKALFYRAGSEEGMELVKIAFASLDGSSKSDGKGDTLGVEDAGGMDWTDPKTKQAIKSNPRLAKVIRRRIRRKENRQVRRQAHEMERAMANMALGNE